MNGKTKKPTGPGCGFKSFMLGVVIKKIPVREYDELAICYTDTEGKRTFQAKSILKPSSVQAGHLDVLNLADFNLVAGNGYLIITSAYCVNAFYGLKSSPKAMAAAFFLIELFDKAVMEGDRDDRLWRFLNGKLEFLDANARNINHKEFISLAHGEALEALGYSVENSIEEITGKRFKSLQFGGNMI